MPLKNISPATMVAQPGTSCPCVKCWITTQMPYPMATSASAPPSALPMRRGKFENAVMPDAASDSSALSPNPLLPRARAGGSKSIEREWNPTQAYRPFMNRVRSGRLHSASTTQRSSSRKSPALGGISIDEPNFINA